MTPDLWLLVRDADTRTATHALLAAAVKHSRLLGDFLDLVVRERFRLFAPDIPKNLWETYLMDCRGRDHDMPHWNDSTRVRLRSTVFQILAQAGYIESTSSVVLRRVDVEPPVIRYLVEHHELYVLRCIQVS